MARITIYMTLPDEDIVRGWGGGDPEHPNIVHELEGSVKATLHELIGDDGDAYQPHVLGIDVDDD